MSFGPNSPFYEAGCLIGLLLVGAFPRCAADVFTATIAVAAPTSAGIDTSSCRCTCGTGCINATRACCRRTASMRTRSCIDAIASGGTRLISLILLLLFAGDSRSSRTG